MKEIYNKYAHPGDDEPSSIRVTVGLDGTAFINQHNGTDDMCFVSRRDLYNLAHALLYAYDNDYEDIVGRRGEQ